MFMFKCFQSTKFYLSAFVICFLLFVGSLVLAFYGMPLIIQQSLEKSVRLEEGTEQYERFQEIPFPIMLKVYVFSLTNYEAVLNGEIPDLKQNGPYAYKQYKTRKVLETDSANDTITYEETNIFKFSAEDSPSCTEDDELTVLNPSVLGAMQSTTFGKDLLNTYLNYIFPVSSDMTNPLFITAKVKDLLFDGLKFAGENENCDKDPMCKIVKALVVGLGTKLKNVDVRDDGLYFSYLNYKNGTKKETEKDKGIFTVKRGFNEITDLGRIIEWNKNTSLNLYKGVKSTDDAVCNDLRGTDSTIYRPKLNHVKSLDVFNTDVCRVVTIDYQGTKDYQGLTGHLYESTNNTLRSTKKNPEEDCFCVQHTPDKDNNPNCYLDGVTDMEPCAGSNILLSHPHFLWADESYTNGVKGLSPSPEKHKIFLNLEPNTGTILQGAKRIQLNMVLKKDDGFPFTTKIQGTVLPLIWVEESINLPDKYVQQVKDDYFSKVKDADIIKYVVMAVTGVLSLAFLGLYVKNFLKN